MAFTKYTQCYAHTPGDKPFHIDDLAALALGASAPGLIAGLLLALAGLGPFGVGIGAAIAFIQAITFVADEWLFHRLVCVNPGGGPRCAVGTVLNEPEVAGLGNFDNDESFDLRLMPHREGDDYATANTVYPSGQPGPTADGKTELEPANDVYLDALQGQTLMRPVLDLPYDTTRTALHVEAEGDFWVKMKEFVVPLGVLVGITAAAATAGGIAGGVAGAALGCALLSFLGPLGCLIGAILGALIGGAIGAAAAAAIPALITYAVVQAIFDDNPGDVEDANVGDHALGPIRAGDKVVVYGEHVYDGFHEGWHELHPLMAVMKLDDRQSSAYLEWNPDFDAGVHTLPGDPPGIPPALAGLTPAEMRRGLESERFRRRCTLLIRRWCGLLDQAFDAETRKRQRRAEHRWTIHPAVDGCRPEPEEP